MENIDKKVKEKDHLAEEVEAYVKETKERLREVDAFENGRETEEQRFRDGAHEQLTQLTRKKALSSLPFIFLECAL